MRNKPVVACQFVYWRVVMPAIAAARQRERAIVTRTAS
jgi:hypothetical protein